MSEAVRTALIPERQSLVGPLGCSVVLHVGTLLGAWIAGALLGLVALVPSCATKEPVDPMVVEIVSLPKRLNVPDRAAVAPAATGNVATPEPPPVQESDLVIHQEEPEPDPGNTEEDRVKQVLADAERRRLLLEMDAPDGPVDRFATDPNGAENLEFAVLGAQSQGDPEVARWKARVRDQMKALFKPLGASTDLKTSVLITFDPQTGQILTSEVTRASGVLAFDAAAERAVQEAGRIELPPAKYRELFAREGVELEFTPPNR